MSKVMKWGKKESRQEELPELYFSVEWRLR